MSNTDKLREVKATKDNIKELRRAKRELKQFFKLLSISRKYFV